MEADAAIQRVKDELIASARATEESREKLIDFARLEEDMRHLR